MPLVNINLEQPCQEKGHRDQDAQELGFQGFVASWLNCLKSLAPSGLHRVQRQRLERSESQLLIHVALEFAIYIIVSRHFVKRSSHDSSRSAQGFLIWSPGPCQAHHATKHILPSVYTPVINKALCKLHTEDLRNREIAWLGPKTAIPMLFHNGTGDALQVTRILFLSLQETLDTYNSIGHE